jgi:hypothetical protein
MASNRESIRRSSEVTASRNDKQALSHARERLSVFVHPFLQARQALFQSRHAILRKDTVRRDDDLNPDLERSHGVCRAFLGVILDVRLESTQPRE